MFVDFSKAFDSIGKREMEQILLAYGHHKEAVIAVKVRPPDGDTDFFDVVSGVLQGDTLAPFFFSFFFDTQSKLNT